MTTAAAVASPVDFATYGDYSVKAPPRADGAFVRPVYRFQGRVSADGSTGYPAEACYWTADGKAKPQPSTSKKIKRFIRCISSWFGLLSLTHSSLRALATGKNCCRSGAGG